MADWIPVDVQLYQSALDSLTWSPVFGDPDIARTCDYCGPLEAVQEWAKGEAVAQRLLYGADAVRWDNRTSGVLQLEGRWPDGH